MRQTSQTRRKRLPEKYLSDDVWTQYFVAEQVEEKSWPVLHAQVDDPVSNNYVYEI